MASALTQGVAVAVGLQKSFDWRGVAASAVGAGVSNVVGDALGMNTEAFRTADVGEQFAKRLVTGLAAGAVAAVARGSRVVTQQIAVDAFGNAVGSSLVDQMQQPSQTEPVSMPDANTRVDSRMPTGRQRTWSSIKRSSATMENRGVAGSSHDILLAAGLGFKVEVSGVGWTRDFQLQDGTVVLKSAMDADDLRRKIADLPLDGVAPDVPGYALYGTEVFERLGVRDAYYMPAPVSVDSMAVQDDFRRFEIAEMNAAGQDFQAVNDQRVATGTYDRFSEIGSARNDNRLLLARDAQRRPQCNSTANATLLRESLSNAIPGRPILVSGRAGS